MRDFEGAKELFVDTVDPNMYFDSMSAELAKNEIIDATKDKTVPLVFIIGDPGVGKSYILKFIDKHLKDEQLGILIDHPFFDKRDLLKILYSAIGLEFEKGRSFNELKESIVDAYKEQKHTIFIDEAQLLNEEQFELIRILSDTKVFQFVLSMHKEEGRAILQKKHFKSRTKIVIEYGNLSKEETHRYIQSTLFEHSFGEIASLFTQKHTQKIHRYANGNFRTVKKFLYSLMRLLEYAKKNGKENYQKINDILLMMSALDIGVIHE